jgi:tRNA 2-thiouridine synthesizing protein B
MSVLHTLNAAPSSSAYADCVRLLAAGDALLLLGDAVYAALEDTTACSQLRDTGADLYVLEADARSAGIQGRVNTKVITVGFDAFAALTEKFPKQQAWY